MIIKFPRCHPFTVRFDRTHWRPKSTHHGKRSNPKVLALHLVNLNRRDAGHADHFSGARLWLYVRGGYACYAEIHVDRRR